MSKSHLVNKEFIDKVPSEMHLLEHLAELRKRLIRVFIAVGLGSLIAFNYSEELFKFIAQPFFFAFSTESMIGTAPAEAFVLRLQLSLFGGIVLVLPIIFQQVWAFVSPGLLESERRLVIPFILTTTGLFLLGLWFCYQIVLPIAFEFFQSEYKSLGVTPAIKVNEHLGFLVRALVAFGIVFEMPVLAFILGRFGIIDHRLLVRGFRYAIVLIFIVSAVLTPPDIISQLLMAGPLIVLYLISIGVLKFTAKHNKE